MLFSASSGPGPPEPPFGFGRRALCFPRRGWGAPYAIMPFGRQGGLPKNTWQSRVTGPNLVSEGCAIFESHAWHAGNHEPSREKSLRTV